LWSGCFNPLHNSSSWSYIFRNLELFVQWFSRWASDRLITQGRFCECEYWHPVSLYALWYFVSRCLRYYGHT
jgi:hypothetical protein